MHLSASGLNWMRLIFTVFEMKKTIKQQTSVSPENQKKTLELFFRYFETKKLLLWPTLVPGGVHWYDSNGNEL